MTQEGSTDDCPPSQLNGVPARRYPQWREHAQPNLLIIFSTDSALGCVQTGATMLGVVACVLAVVYKRMQQLSTGLGPVVHSGKNTTHKSL